MIEVETTISVARSAADVFDFVADMANNPDWQRGMQSCRWTSEPPIRVGSKYDQVASFLGREIRSSFVVTEYEPGRMIRIETTSGPMPIDVTRTVEAEGADSCRVSAVVRGDAAGLFRITEPLMRVMVDRSVRQDYVRLKAALESDPKT